MRFWHARADPMMSAFSFAAAVLGWVWDLAPRDFKSLCSFSPLPPVSLRDACMPWLRQTRWCSSERLCKNIGRFFESLITLPGCTDRRYRDAGLLVFRCDAVVMGQDGGGLEVRDVRADDELGSGSRADARRGEWACVGDVVSKRSGYALVELSLQVVCGAVGESLPAP